MNDEHAESSELQLKCPTCGATQPWSVACRRCKSDLGLVVATLREMQRFHCECLAALDVGNITIALTAARRRWELSPDETSARLVAVCHAMLNRFDVVEQLMVPYVNDR